MRREGRRVRCGNDVMFGSVDHRPLGLGVAPPEDKNETLPLFIQNLHDGVGKVFPTFFLMGARLTGLDSERRIEQEHALLCPGGEISCRRSRQAEITLELGKDVFK